MDGWRTHIVLRSGSNAFCPARACATVSHKNARAEAKRTAARARDSVKSGNDIRHALFQSPLNSLQSTQPHHVTLA